MERSTVDALLQDLAESPAPPSGVDIARAVASGRRRVQVRRLASATAAVVVALALVATFAVFRGFGRGEQLPPAQTRLDPTMQIARMDWLPEGAVWQYLTVDRDLFVSGTYFQGMGVESATGLAQIALIVAAPGKGIDPLRFGDYLVDVRNMPAGEPADPVRAQPARWVADGGQRTALRWQYAPGAWAAVLVEYAQSVTLDVREVAARVAENSHFGLGTPVPLPVQVTGLPPGLELTSVDVRLEGGENYYVMLGFGDGTNSAHDWPLTILALREDGRTQTAQPNTTVGGHPARLTTGDDGGQLLQFDEIQGVYLELATHRPATTALLPGGLVGLFSSLQLEPDIARWR
jgi:hypothetical protein